MGGSCVTRPLERVAADIVELPLTTKGNRYVLVVEDYFTKFVNLYSLPNQTAQTVARCLFEDYVLVHGVPERLHTDQGCQFEAEGYTEPLSTAWNHKNAHHSLQSEIGWNGGAL